LESQDECKTGTQSNCAAVGGFWSAPTCNQYAGALSYANASTICTAHNFYYVQLAKMDCCGGNMGTLCGNAGDGICANNADFTPAVTAGIQCNVYSQQARDDCSASGYEVSDDKCELVPGAAECSAVGGAWTSTSCHTSATFMQIMIAQGMNFSQPGAVVMPLTLQSRCCGGNPGSGLYGALPQMCQSGTTMTSSAIASSNCNVRLPTMQNACTSAGYGLTGDDGTECSSDNGTLTIEQCRGIGGVYEPFTCAQVQVYLAYNASVAGDECTDIQNAVSQNCCNGNGALNLCPRVTACDARARCGYNSGAFNNVVGVSESCFEAVGQAGIPDHLLACQYPFVAANVSVECQQAVEGALNASGCPRVTACPAFPPNPAPTCPFDTAQALLAAPIKDAAAATHPLLSATIQAIENEVALDEFLGPDRFAAAVALAEAAPLKAAAAATFPSLSGIIQAMGTKEELLAFLDGPAATTAITAASQEAIAAADRCDRNPSCVEP
jgi:hypothetical protein